MAALWHKTYAEWMGSLHGAEVSEVFDTQMDVEQDPCGAHWAIHHMDAEITRLTAELTALRAGQDALAAAAYEAAADHAGGAWFFSFPTDDRKEPYRNAARAIHALTPADATAALDSMLRAERDKALRDAAGAICEWGEDAPQSGQFFAEAILAMIETEANNDR